MIENAVDGVDIRQVLHLQSACVDDASRRDASGSELPPPERKVEINYVGTTIGTTPAPARSPVLLGRETE
jgi:hypothetical protein